MLSLLNDNGIIVDSDDRVSPSVTTPVTTGMTVTINKVDVKQESGEQAIDFKTVTTEDAALGLGESRPVPMVGAALAPAPATAPATAPAPAAAVNAAGSH